MRSAAGHRRLRSQAILRGLLGRYLGTDPAGLRFQLGAHGKPRLAGEQAWLAFNMSHSGAIALYAVGRDLELGVDVETLARGVAVAKVAERAFGSAVAARLARLDPLEGKRELLRLWVRHEACLKCSGVGLGAVQAREHAPFTPTEDGEKTDRTSAGARWVSAWELVDGRAVAALAASSAPKSVVRGTLGG